MATFTQVNPCLVTPNILSQKILKKNFSQPINVKRLMWPKINSLTLLRFVARNFCSHVDLIHTFNNLITFTLYQIWNELHSIVVVKYKHSLISERSQTGITSRYHELEERTITEFKKCIWTKYHSIYIWVLLILFCFLYTQFSRKASWEYLEFH